MKLYFPSSKLIYISSLQLTKPAVVLRDGKTQLTIIYEFE